MERILRDIQEHFQNSHDLKLDQFKRIVELHVMYLSSLCDVSVIKQSIVRPYLDCEDKADFYKVLDAALSCRPASAEPKELIGHLLSGNALILFDGQFYRLYAEKKVNNQPLGAASETTIQGPQVAFSEDIETNMSLIRNRYPSPHLIAEEKRIGRVTRTKVSIVYDQKLVKQDILKELMKRLDTIDVDVLQSVGQLEALLSGKRLRLFPTMVITERPDRVSLNLSQGKIALLVQGTPFVLIAPAVFYDFMTAMDDIYQTFWVSRTIVVLRYVALFITIVLPAAYVAIVSYNPEIFRVQFTLSVAGSRAAVPYPSFIEVLIMLFMIEALIEASIRLPKTIGSTATTVGGLILGQAAQQAGLVSSIMIIITSAVAISNFVIPLNEMSFAMRVVKYPLIALAIFFGVVGLVAGFFCFLLYLASLNSFGATYFRLYLGEPATSGYKEGDSS